MAEKTTSRAKKEDMKTRIERLEAVLESRLLHSDGAPGAGDLERRITALEKRLLEEGGDAWQEAEPAAEEQPLGYCALPPVPPRTFGPDISPERARLIQTISKKWVNGTKLRYYFFSTGSAAGSEAQKNIVRQGFEIWKNVGIGVSFEEVSDIGAAEIRIGFVQGDGAWSYVGRDVVDIPGQSERTMNFGWDLRNDPRGVDVPVHEIGHTLGFPHEHQNPFAGIVWDEEAVYRYFGGPPNNWDRSTTDWNILRKLSTSEVQGSQWDPDSIMHYAFGPGLIRQPEQYRNGIRPPGGLSARDVAQAKVFYPPLTDTQNPELKPFRSHTLTLGPGEQVNFNIRPTATRNYTIQTFGGADTVIVLFEEVNGDLRYVKGDDDSGTDRNARLTQRLVAGRKYVLRLRMYYSFASGETAVMLW